MKKILIAIAIILTIGVNAKAQGGNDSFFSGWGDDSRIIADNIDPTALVLPIWLIGTTDNDEPQAPLGSGLLIMSGLGVGYAVAKRKKK